MSVKRSSAVWALITALGASYLVVGLALAVRQVALPLARDLELTLTNRMLYLGGLAEPILLSLTFATGAATGAFVARRVGGVAIVTVYAVSVIVAGASFVYSASLREQQLRGSECCVIVMVGDLPVAAAAVCIPPLIGLIIGAAIARRRVERAGPNAFLEAAGSYAIVGALASLALGPPVPMLVMAPYALAFAPYATVGLDAPLHAFVVALQVLVSAAVYVHRGGTSDVRGLGSFALMGLAGVAYADLLEIWFTLTLDHHYVPVSLVVVPLASVGLAVVLVLALRSISSLWTRAPRNCET
jgi:hypothetical protein